MQLSREVLGCFSGQMQFTTGSSRQSQRKLPSSLEYICTPHRLLFRLLKRTDFHGANVLTGPGLWSVPVIPFFLLSFLFWNKKNNKKQKIWFENEFELIGSFISRTRQMHNSAKREKSCNNTSGLKPKAPLNVRQMSLPPEHLEATRNSAPYGAAAECRLLQWNSVSSDPGRIQDAHN